MLSIDMRPRVRDGWGPWASHRSHAVPTVPATEAAVRCLAGEDSGQVSYYGQVWQFRVTPKEGEGE